MYQITFDDDDNGQPESPLALRSYLQVPHAPGQRIPVIEHENEPLPLPHEPNYHAADEQYTLHFLPPPKPDYDDPDKQRLPSFMVEEETTTITFSSLKEGDVHPDDWHADTDPGSKGFRALHTISARIGKFFTWLVPPGGLCASIFELLSATRKCTI